jgi:hypothetical protein
LLATYGHREHDVIAAGLMYLGAGALLWLMVGVLALVLW